MNVLSGAPAMQCPKCSAQLPPLARACQYCGLETHHGAQERAREADLHAHGQRQERDAAGRAMASRANLAMLLGLGSLVTCCFPVGIGAIVMGVQSNGLAKKANLHKDPKALVGIVVGALSILAFTGMCIVVAIQHAQQANRAADIAKATDEKRKAAEIDMATACSLAEARIIADGYSGKTLLDKFTCRGPFDSKSTHPTLQGIDAEMSGVTFKLQACFLRNDKRWFVVSVQEGGTCEAMKLTNATGPTPVEWEVAEAEARVNYRGEVSRLRSEKTTSALADLPRILKGTTAPATCPVARFKDLQAKRPGSPLKPLTFDAELLKEGSKDAAGGARWKTLTSRELVPLFDKSADANAKGKASEELSKRGESLVVAYVTDSRDWPVGKVVKGKAGYAGGSFVGRMVIVDLESRSALCAAPLNVETDAAVKYTTAKGASLESQALALEAAAIQQLQSRIEDKATEQMKVLSGGALKLGYKALE
ncbi:MAG: DUF4190 domain-containing protein [Polyangiaceae bacterium]